MNTNLIFKGYQDDYEKWILCNTNDRYIDFDIPGDVDIFYKDDKWFYYLGDIFGYRMIEGYEGSEYIFKSRKMILRNMKMKTICK